LVSDSSFFHLSAAAAEQAIPEAKRAGEERSNGKWVSERSEEEMERTKHVGVGEMGVLDENLEMKVMCKRHGVGV